MVKVRIVKFNGHSTTYKVEFPNAYIAKIIENQEKIKRGVWVDGDTNISIKEIYANEKLIAEFDGSELRLVKEKPKPKKTAGMGRYKGHTVPAGCDVGQYAVDEALKIAKDLKDQITAEEDWNEYQAEILHAQKMIKENIWVMDHTGGNIEITYIPMSL
jgi:hypothetical protein